MVDAGGSVHGRRPCAGTEMGSAHGCQREHF